MDRAQKRELVTTLNEEWKDSGVIVVAHYKGMTVAQMTDFRKRMKEAGGSVKVAKNKLAKLALKDTEVETISDLLKGQTCVAYSEDPVSAARVSVKYAKENDKLVILGGAMGKTSARQQRREGACRLAVARRAARQAAGPAAGPCNQDRPHPQRARRHAGPRAGRPKARRRRRAPETHRRRLINRDG